MEFLGFPERKLVDQNRHDPDSRLANLSNERQPLFMLEVSKVKRLLFRLSQADPDTVNQFDGIRIGSLLCDYPGKHKPIRTSLPK